jgi:hypothetical protein
MNWVPTLAFSTWTRFASPNSAFPCPRAMN